MTDTKESKRLSIADIKRTNAAAGQHWFEPGALRFFNSKVLPTVYQGPGGVYFVTSERYDERQPLRFSVRKAIEGGKRIDTVGEFQAHTDAAGAIRVAKLRAAGATDVYERTASPAKAKAKSTAVRGKKTSKPKADTKTRRKRTKKRTPPTTATPVAAPPKEPAVKPRPAAPAPSPAAPTTGGPQRRAAVALSEMVSALTRAEHVNTCEEAWDALSEARRHRMAARRHLLSVPTSQASGSAELVRTLVMADERAADLVRKLGVVPGHRDGGVVIGAPLNDHECLGKLTQVAAEGATSAEVRKVAARFDSTYELATWIRSLPQRNDEGDEGDGPRVACDVSQRARVLAEDPNCVERSLLYLAAGEVLDSSPVRQLATIETPRGRHTFPVEDGEPVVLDPQVTRNALSAGLYLIRQASDAAHDAEQAAPDPSDLLPWIAEVAEEPAEARDGRVGIQRVRRARGVFRAVLAGKPANPEAMGDVLYTLDRAEEAAPMFGQVARSAIRLARAALKTLAKRGVKPRNGCGCQDSTPPIRNAGALAHVIPASLAPRNINWKRLGYWGGKGLARVLGVGDLYDPGIAVAKQQVSRLKAAPAAPRRQGTPPVFGLLPFRASPPSQTRAAQMPALLALLTGKGR